MDHKFTSGSILTEVFAVFFGNFVNKQTLGKIIRRNTEIGSELQGEVFIVPAP